MKTILVIDDNVNIRENTTEILELEKYIVHTAENGKIGVEVAIREIPDLILCDITMPVLDGFGVFLELNKNLTTAGIPFIFLTAKAEASDKQRGINLGIDDYITKPFDDRILVATIEAKIRKNEIAKEKINNERLIYIKELEDMLAMTSHKIRKPICTFLGLMQLIEKDAKLNDEDVRKILMELKANALDLDVFTRELTTFMHDAKERTGTS